MDQKHSSSNSADHQGAESLTAPERRTLLPGWVRTVAPVLVSFGILYYYFHDENLADILETHSVPPEKAAHLALELVSGRFDALTGRVFRATEDLDTVEANIDRILDKDSRRLLIS